MKLTKLREDKYRLFWEIGFDTATGKRKQRTEVFNGSRKSAEKRWREVQGEIDEGIVVDPQNMRFSELLERWQRDVLPMRVRPSTLANYNVLIRVHILPQLGHLKLDKINPVILQRFYRNKLEQDDNQNTGGKLSHRTVRYIHSIIRMSLDQAVKWNLVIRNVADIVDQPRETKKEMTVWNPEQVGIFLSFLREHRLYALYFIALATGMRQGEILGLRWSDIDWQTKQFYVATSLSPGRELSEVKPANSKRNVSVSADVLAVLKQHRVNMLEEKLALGQEYVGNEDQLVFHSSIGTPLSARNVLRHFKAMQKKCGVPEIRFHDLRHTSATLMLMKGIHPKVVSERLGHSSVKFTMEKYSHVLPNMQEEAAAVLDEYLKN